MLHNQINLSDDQIPHFDEIMNIADKHPVIKNTTPTGGGKTIIVAEFMRQRKIKRSMIICNNDIQINHWQEHKNKYNLPITNIMTYDTLRGSSTFISPSGKEMCNHGFLYKINHQINLQPCYGLQE